MDSNKKIWMTLGGIALVMLFIIVLQVFVRTPYTTMKIAAIPEGEYDPAVWGQHYPLEYKSYLRNKEMTESPTGFPARESFPSLRTKSPWRAEPRRSAPSLEKAISSNDRGAPSGRG